MQHCIVTTHFEYLCKVWMGHCVAYLNGCFNPTLNCPVVLTKASEFSRETPKQIKQRVIVDMVDGRVMIKNIEQQGAGPHNQMFGQSCPQDIKLFVDEHQYTHITSKINEKGAKYHFSMAKRKMILFSFLIVCVAYILIIRFSFRANSFYWYIPLIVFTIGGFLIQMIVPEAKSRKFHKSCIRLVNRENQDPRAMARGTVYEINKQGTIYHLVINYVNSTVLNNNNNTTNYSVDSYVPSVVAYSPNQVPVNTVPYYPQPLMYPGASAPPPQQQQQQQQFQTTPTPYPPPKQGYQID
ncbi:hypothetical protein DFA_07902 [Cavenderia fasciculata]|uniref:Uncharacterized protein n=1 Tax=Cavenderia fasciculata TaxID=261658 RepID=F4Q407_CACFS|nr:uncharacterized protein DFA_07902 [Cavenderia fasciculata]EGG16921.1 hypothetical protein DFA_07902 [Cavenderia fasciculata]|eukprot:XP_004355395.1 hypothetical protein DFA_07902 [Cavenderia fasciculata]